MMSDYDILRMMTPAERELFASLGGTPAPARDQIVAEWPPVPYRRCFGGEPQFPSHLLHRSNVPRRPVVDPAADLQRARAHRDRRRNGGRAA